jgi:hypothetical protein
MFEATHGLAPVPWRRRDIPKVRAAKTLAVSVRFRDGKAGVGVQRGWTADSRNARCASKKPCVYAPPRVALNVSAVGRAQLTDSRRPRGNRQRPGAVKSLRVLRVVRGSPCSATRGRAACTAVAMEVATARCQLTTLRVLRDVRGLLSGR